jgi:hypothetical protein
MKNKKLLWYVLAIISSLCLVCVVAVIAIESGPQKTKAERYAETYDGSVTATWAEGRHGVSGLVSLRFDGGFSFDEKDTTHD